MNCTFQADGFLRPWQRKSDDRKRPAGDEDRKMHGDDHGAYDTDVLITGAGRQGWSWHCSAARDYRVAGRARRFSSVDRAPTEGGKGQHPTSRARPNN
jgi:hypothetical protein